MRKETTYNPESQLKRPKQFILSFLNDLQSSSELGYRLFLRNLRSQYRQSLLGYIWIFVPPTATALIWIILNQSKIINVGETQLPYPVYVFTGTMIWQSFIDAIRNPLKQINSSKSIMSKINVPWESFLFSGFAEVIFNFAVRLAILLIILLVFSVQISFMSFLSLLTILALILFGFSIGLLVLPVGSLYQDIEKGIPLVTTFWFYLTPVVYVLPESGLLKTFASINPVTPLIVSSRELLTGFEVSQLFPTLVISGITIILLTLGLLFCRIAKPHLISRIT